MIKVSDYITTRLVEFGIRHVFMVTGGAAMHLNDSFGSCQQIQCIFNLHEQACAIAAEGYYRASGKIAVVNVTSGPGGTNTITGLLGQWLDSIPCVFLSGQVRQQTTIASCPDLELRQLGDQEINIADIVRPITKYAVMVRDANTIRFHLEKAFHLATHGRPGPTWLDIPLDIQAAVVDEGKLEPYDPSEDEIKLGKEKSGSIIDDVIERIRISKRPVILAGHGIRLSGGCDTFNELVDLLNIPVLTAINGHDLINSDHPLFFGRPGIVGDRVGNMIIQNCDLLIVIGARMGVRQISYNYDSFARSAFKIMVDIDPAELCKPTLRVDLPIRADASWFIHEIIKRLDKPIKPKNRWLEWCQKCNRTLPSIYEDNRINPDYVNSYTFADKLFNNIDSNAVVVTGNATAYTSTYQIMKIKKGVRVFTNQACAAMGYDLPAAIGACFSLGKKPVILITGDGSIQMNIQELNTIRSHNLPIKIFVLNNQGYLAIRITQDTYFQGRHTGSEPAGGLFLPNLQAIASAYEIPSIVIQNDNELDGKIPDIIKVSGPVLCEIMMDPHQTLHPKLSSVILPDGRMESSPLEDMYPYLPRDLFNSLMIVEPLPQSKQI